MLLTYIDPHMFGPGHSMIMVRGSAICVSNFRTVQWYGIAGQGVTRRCSRSRGGSGRSFVNVNRQNVRNRRPIPGFINRN